MWSLSVVRCNTGFEASGNNRHSWSDFGKMLLKIMQKQLKVSKHASNCESTPSTSSLSIHYVKQNWPHIFFCLRTSNRNKRMFSCLFTPSHTLSHRLLGCEKQENSGCYSVYISHVQVPQTVTLPLNKYFLDDKSSKRNSSIPCSSWCQQIITAAGERVVVHVISAYSG